MVLTDKEASEIVADLRRLYHSSAIILYGSYSRGTATPISDLDVYILSDTGEKRQDIRPWRDTHLDVFVAPTKSAGEKLDDSLIRLHSGVLLFDESGYGAVLLKEARATYEKGPPQKNETERAVVRTWVQRMLSRVERDQNSLYRSYSHVRLLHDLLPIYFELRNQWYLGPKASLESLATDDMETATLYKDALKAMSFDATEKLALRILAQ